MRRLSDPDHRVRIQAALECYDTTMPGVYEAVVSRIAVEKDPRVVATLVRAAALTGRERARGVVAGALRHPDARVRANAVESLSLCHRDGGGSYVERMLHDPHHRVRGAALLGMASLDLVRFRREVLSLARSTRPEECLAALFVLERFNETWTTKLLEEMVLRHDNPVRVQTERILEERAAWGGGRVQEVLAAVRGGGELLPSRQVMSVHIPPKVTLGNVRDFLSDDSVDSRIVAVQEAAQRLPHTKIVPLLCDFLKTESDSRVVATMTKWLGLCGGDDIIDILIPYLRSSDARIRANTLEGLSASSDSRVEEEARRLLSDGSPRVRARAATLLARREGGASLWVVLELFVAGDEEGAASALASLPRLNERIVVEVLDMALLKGGEGFKKALESLLARLSSTVPLAASLEASLHRKGFLAEEGGFVRETLKRLTSSDDSVREKALDELVHCQSSNVWDMVGRLAQSDRSSRVRQKAERMAMAFERERYETALFYEAGLRMLQLYEAGALRMPELFSICEKIVVIERCLEDDQPHETPERLVLHRKTLVVALGRRGVELLRSGTLSDPLIARVVDKLKEDSSSRKKLGE